MGGVAGAPTLPYSFEREILDLISDKWAMLIVNDLGASPKRFTQLRTGMAGISHKMLTQTLRGLERYGIVQRYVHATVPPRVDYSLTQSGLDLLETIHGLCGWSRRNRERIEAARDEFDHWASSR
jgi:DNA-binding HxlR family transcriptional regulator